jgi:Cobalamin-independent synthase, N-terminal domain
MQTTVLGYPRIGGRRELKKATESFWAGRADAEELGEVASDLRRATWETLRDAGLTSIPSGTFSLYDHVLDTALWIHCWTRTLSCLVCSAGPVRRGCSWMNRSWPLTGPAWNSPLCGMLAVLAAARPGLGLAARPPGQSRMRRKTSSGVRGARMVSWPGG